LSGFFKPPREDHGFPPGQSRSRRVSHDGVRLNRAATHRMSMISDLMSRRQAAWTGLEDSPPSRHAFPARWERAITNAIRLDDAPTRSCIGERVIGWREEDRPV